MGMLIYESSGTFNPAAIGLSPGDTVNVICIGGGGGGGGAVHAMYGAPKGGNGGNGGSSSFGAYVTSAGGSGGNGSGKTTTTLQGQYFPGRSLLTSSVAVIGGGAGGFILGCQSWGGNGGYALSTDSTSFSIIDGGTGLSGTAGWGGFNFYGSTIPPLLNLAPFGFNNAGGTISYDRKRMFGNSGLSKGAGRGGVTSINSGLSPSGGGGSGYGAGGGGASNGSTESAYANSGCSGFVQTSIILLTQTDPISITVGGGGGGGGGAYQGNTSTNQVGSDGGTGANGSGIGGAGASTNQATNPGSTGGNGGYAGVRGQDGADAYGPSGGGGAGGAVIVFW